MKAIMPKVFNQLSKNEQQRIMKSLEDAMDNELCEAQFIWLKMACIILHDMGLPVDDITTFVGKWKMMYRTNSRFPDKAAQDAFLEPKLAEIFGQGGFPEEFVQSFKKIGR